MELNEISELWNDINMDNSEISINQDALSELTAYKLQDKLSEIKWTAIFEIVVAFFWLIFLIGFAIDNFEKIQLFLPALSLIIISILSLIMEAFKLSLFWSIRHQFSIIHTQRRIEKLRCLELLDTNSLFVLIPLFFVPFIIVIVKAVSGLNIFDLGFGLNEILMLTGGSFVVSMIIVFILKKFPLQELKDSLDFLNDLKHLEED